MIHSLSVSFISGMKIGLELFTGEDLYEEDAFALTIDLLIIRLTYIISYGE